MQKLFEQIVRTVIPKCSKKLFLNFYGNMRGEGQSYPGVQFAAWNVTKETSSKIISCDLFEITHNFYPAVGQLRSVVR